jgi:TolB protein
VRRLVLALLLVLPALLPSAAEAAFPGANGKIAFAHELTHQDVVAVNPDGTGFANLTTTPLEEESQPAWAPDGSKIAFVSQTGVWGLRLMNADGSGRTGLTFPPVDSADAEPAWSPDGQELVFSRLTSGRCVTEHCGEHLFVVDADGSDVTQLTFGTEIEIEPAWSPDGSRIAFTRWSDCDPGCERDVYTIRPDGSDMTRLTELNRTEYDPSWSPDGERIAFVFEQPAGNEEIYTMAADGTDTQRVTTTQGPGGFTSAVDPAWSPDGERIAFRWVPLGVCQTNSCGFEIFTVRTDGTDYRRVTNDNLRDQTPDWQRLNRAPQCDGLTATMMELWPPNRHFLPVSVSGGSDPEGDPVSLEITEVTQDEPVRTRGDSTSPDARRGSAPDEVRLRAERNPFGDGRVYRLAVQGSDGRGGTCEGEVTIEVRRHAGVAAVDSGPPRFDSFG